MIRAKKPRKSLRTFLIWTLLSFSVVPLAFITGYSLVKYEQAIDQELSTRLLGNSREIGQILEDFQRTIQAESTQISSDRTLTFYLGSNKVESARETVKRWFKGAHAQRIWIFNRDARLEIALGRNDRGEVERKENLEAAIEMNEPLLNALKNKDTLMLVDFNSEATNDPQNPKNSAMELSIFSKVYGQGNRLVGYTETAISVDEQILRNLRNRLNAEIFFFRPDKSTIVATHDDLELYKPEVFASHVADGDFFEMNIRQNPFRLLLREMKWGDAPFVMGLGVSKSAATQVLNNVRIAFYSVVAIVVIFLIILSVIVSRMLLRPIYSVLDAIEETDFDKSLLQIPTENETELGLLAESFNDLSRRTFESQKQLKEKIQELEKANNEIRDTQSKLVHTAKMASLGQLVAGVAHELNNPIGFIYSNMTHLREYSEKLIHLIDVAEHEPEKLEKEKKKSDLPYIVNDLPKLITSCEDGARRTRDIVLGLRNFSRLEEAQVKQVDLHEGLENTLNLLSGELKNRVKVVKHFEKIPKVNCYPSQLNQVFMNVLSNAAQAIDHDGEIHITTRMHGPEKVEVSIRDTGKGMNKQTLEKVFDPFFTTKGVGHGTGLGLSISYGVIQKHGGDILVSSELGKGTEFKIVLPINGPIERTAG